MRRSASPASPDADAERVAGLEQRIAELEQVVAALARFAVRDGGGADVYLLPGNRVIDGRADAALIRTASRKRQD